MANGSYLISVQSTDKLFVESYFRTIQTPPSESDVARLWDTLQSRNCFLCAKVHLLVPECSIVLAKSSPRPGF